MNKANTFSLSVATALLVTAGVTAQSIPNRTVVRVAHPTAAPAAAVTIPAGFVAVPDGKLSAPKASGSTGQVVAAAKRTLAPDGVWTWTSLNRNFQPVHNFIRLSADTKGKIVGTLTDGDGDHAIDNVRVGNGTVSFDITYHVRGHGDLAHTFTVDLDADTPAVSIARPDFSPLGKANGGKRTDRHAARHSVSG